MPDYVVFLDHKPHPVFYLSFLAKELKEANLKPHFIFHLYGDFTLNFSEWGQLDKFITDHQVKWFAASPRQKNLLSEFILGDQIDVCPFPVDENEFYYDEKIREGAREKYQWGKDEIIFLFTGRLSRQKRIHQLIPAFSQWLSHNPVKAKLVLVGDSDKLGEPWLLRHEMDYEYFHHLRGVISSLPKEHQNLIELHGFQPNKILLQYYNAADSLVNISVHNDEDYGMSCAEAQACGLPLILTDWAGFSGFQLKNLPEAVKYVPVKLDPKGKKIKISTLEEHFSFMSQNYKKIDRKKIRSESLKWTSIKNASEIIHSNLEKLKTFTTFAPNMEKAKDLERYSYRNTFTNKKKRTFNSFYLKVYQHYVGKS